MGSGDKLNCLRWSNGIYRFITNALLVFLVNIWGIRESWVDKWEIFQIFVTIIIVCGLTRIWYKSLSHLQCQIMNNVQIHFIFSKTEFSKCVVKFFQILNWIFLYCLNFNHLVSNKMKHQYFPNVNHNWYQNRSPSNEPINSFETWELWNHY